MDRPNSTISALRTVAERSYDPHHWAWGIVRYIEYLEVQGVVTAAYIEHIEGEHDGH